MGNSSLTVKHRHTCQHYWIFRVSNTVPAQFDTWLFCCKHKTHSTKQTTSCLVTEERLWLDNHCSGRGFNKHQLDLKEYLPCLDPLRSPLGPVLGVYLVSRVAALCRVQSKSSFLSWVNMQMGSSSKLQWNSPGERHNRTELSSHIHIITKERKSYTKPRSYGTVCKQCDTYCIFMRFPGVCMCVHVSGGDIQQPSPNYTIWSGEQNF